MSAESVRFGARTGRLGVCGDVRASPFCSHRSLGSLGRPHQSSRPESSVRSDHSLQSDSAVGGRSPLSGARPACSIIVWR
jgi:hypothetical protein